MRLRDVVLLVMAAACGPSRERIDAEARSYSAIFDYAAETVRRLHLCDAEIADMRRLNAAMPSRFEGLSDADMRDARRAMREAQAGADIARECATREPSKDEIGRGLTRLVDSWLDDCLECATGKACIAESRSLRARLEAVGEKGGAKEQLAAVDAERARPVCAR